MPWFPPYVPVGARRARVARVSDELRRNGVDVQPVHIEGRTIARSFWGRRWCHHLESCSDFENRLPRGRAYVRNGSVCHLDVHAGGVDVVVRIRKLGKAAWKAIRVGVRGSGRIRPRAAPGAAVRSRPARRHRSRPRPVPETRRDYPHLRLSRLGGDVQARGRRALRRRQPARRASRAALPPRVPTPFVL